MARKTGNYAWVVIVPHDNVFGSAVLSGNMIRKTGTAANIVALVSTAVSIETMNELNEVFDMIVVKKALHKIDLPSDCKDNFWLHALTLTAYSKVVVIQAGVLPKRSQGDNLFELEKSNQIIFVNERGTLKMALVVPDVMKFAKIMNTIKLGTTKTRADLLDLIFGNHVTTQEIITTCKQINYTGKTINGDSGIKYPGEQDSVFTCTNINTSGESDNHSNLPDNQSEWIAIVGMSCRFPQADSIDEYWELLINGKNTCSTPPACRTQLVDMDSNVKGNFLKCPIDQFDASFFGFSPTEACFTDPQARLLLEVSWEALEDAGINPDNLRGTKVGVFHGSWLQEYKEAMNENCSPPSQDFLRKYLGNAFGSTAAKISFFYGITGPNVSTESGCSSSMVSIDMASKSLQRKECEMALACGANLIMHMNKQNILWAEDGKSKTFDVGANGYARAEGIAVLVLKRYSDALLDNDNIHGIVRGIGTSQEGLSKSFGSPTVQSEVDAMREALVAAKVMPTEVDYIEAHATGTAVGDPIEAAAIVKAYRSDSIKRESPLIIGSGKTNLGHTESCSGMAGIIKVILSMKHELIPKHINLTRRNPQVDFSPIPGCIPVEPTPWPRKVNQRHRIAGVSSFGITGTDVHVILEEPPIKEECLSGNAPSNPQILTLSAKSEIALEQMTNEFLTYLETSVNSRDIQDITYTANVCRAHHPFRRAVVGSSVAELVKNIWEGCNMYNSTNVTSTPKNICFTFPGRIGTMPLEHIQELYHTIPFFKNMMDSCDHIFKQVLSSSKSLVEALLKVQVESSNTPKGVEWYALLVSYHFSLSQLWNHWGIFPNVVMGHCFGEFSAAVVCGALDLKDVFQMLTTIPHFLNSQSIEPASMTAVNSSHNSVEKLINNFFQNYQTGSSQSDWIDIAAVNSNFQTLVVGPPATITAFQQYCIEKNIKFKSVPGDFCPHSRGIEAACQKSLPTFNKIIHHPIKIPYVSSLTGELVKDSDLNGMFWYKVLRNCVNFKQACISATNTQLVDIFLEIGLDASLTKFTKANLEDRQTCTHFVASFPRKQYGIYNTLAEMFSLGIHLNWDNFHSSGRKNKVSLPHYPFQRKSYWYERNTRAQYQLRSKDQLNCATIVHQFLGGDMGIPPAFGNFAFFKNDNFLGQNQQVNFIYDHKIDTKVIFPGAGFLEMILSSWKLAMKLENSLGYSVEKFTIHEPLLLDKSQYVSIITAVNKDNGNICIYTTNENDNGLQWRLHATADVLLDESVHQLVENLGLNTVVNTAKHNDESEERADEFYSNASKVGLNFGAAFKSLKRVYNTENGDMIAEIKDLNEIIGCFACHPILIDAMIQGFMVHTKPVMTKLHVPVKIDKFVLLSPSSLSGNGKLFVHCQKENTTTVSLINQKGQVVAFIKSPQLVATSTESLLAAAVNKIERLSNKNPVQNSVSLYDVYWKKAEFYQLAPSTTGLNETIDAEFYNELSELQKKESILNVFSEQEAKLDETMNRLCYLYVVKALFEFGWVPELGLNIFKGDHSTVNIEEKWGIVPGLVKAFSHFISYVYGNEEHLKGNTLERVESEIKSILEFPRVKEYAAMGTIHKCGWNLAGILKGEVSPHKILFGDDNLAEHYYRTTRFTRSIETMQKLFTLIASNKAASFKGDQTLKILEIGAGTGVFPQRVIPVLKKMGVKFHYHFTDISRTLVLKAKESLETVSQNFSFNVMNIEIDPLKQGLPVGYFDIVVALDVLHATKNLNDTLRNIQIITKIGGVLLLGETERPVREVDICFGGLDGYWLFEDNIRKNHCTLNSDSWLNIMAENGFNGNICKMLSCEGQMSVISASKTDEKQTEQGVKAQWIVFEFREGAFSEYRLSMETRTNRMFNTLILNPKIRGEQLQRYLNECLLGCHGSLEGVLIWMCPLKCKTCDDMEDPVSREILEPLLYISKYLQHAKLKTLPKMHLVTADCWDLPPPNSLDVMSSQAPSLAQAWGFMRSVRIELPGISSKSIDLEVSSDIHVKITQLTTELWIDDRETEVVYRKGTRFVRRLKEQATYSGAIDIPHTDAYQIELPKSKAIRDIKFTEACEIEHLKQQQVKIEVRSISLNFKDIFAVIKPTREFESLTSIGFDFSGVVIEVGRNVERWKVGDAVFGFKGDQGCMRSHLVTNENLLMPMPSSMTFAEASTLPTVFITAWHCMVNVAKLEKGQTMLLHAASGGVGLAAIQIAKMLGVNVIGTAGSEKKRRFVRKLGVEHVFHSRTLDFETEVSNVTRGRGVDMVLNCLTGPGFKESSLAVCRDGGHFVEISKMDIWSEAEVRDIRPKVNYTIVDLTQVDQSVIQPIMEKLSELVVQGNIKPLHHVTYPANYIGQALSYLQKAKHVGKVVINIPINHAGERKNCIFNDRSTYLITGGKTGIGFEICKWMVMEHGAKYVVLVSRSQPTEIVKHLILDLENRFGATIICKDVDISNYIQCKNLIEEDLKSLPPLRGVHHCAAILSDQLLLNQEWSNFEKVISPKARGAWNLHQLTMEAILEHFVLYSSAVSVFGNVGQTNYTCANSYLDSLTALRASMGRPALSINWGQWKAGLAENVEMTSFEPFSIQEGIKTLNYLMQNYNEQQSQTVAAKANFPGILKLAPHFRNTLLEDFVISSTGNGQKDASVIAAPRTAKIESTSTVCLTTQFKQCKDQLEKENVVRNFILKMLCDTLGTAKEDIKDDARFTDMGMDSLMSIEFTNNMHSAMEENENDDVGREDFSIQLDLEENGTLNKLTSFILKVLEQI